MTEDNQNLFPTLTKKTEPAIVPVEDNLYMQQEQNPQNPPPTIPPVQQPSEAPTQEQSQAPQQSLPNQGPNGELIHNIYKLNPMQLLKIILIAVAIIVIIGGTFYLKQRTTHHGAVKIEQNENQTEMVVEDKAVTSELEPKEE